MAIVSAAEYKTWRAIAVSTYDALIAILIAGAQTEVEKFCGRLFDTATFTEVHNGSGTDILILKNTPIASITSITATTPSGSSSAVASTLFSFQPNNGVIKLASDYRTRWDLGLEAPAVGPTWGQCPVWPAGHQNISVVYVGAYGTPQPAMPSDLKMKFYQYLDYLWTQVPGLAAGGGGGAVPTGYAGEKLGDYEYTLPGDGGFIQRSDGQIISLEWARMRGLFQPFRRGYA